MKKIIVIFLFFISFNLSHWEEIIIDDEDTYFVVSAYYSPLPWQNYYLKWNYEDEIILNWKWLRWASWIGVFTWMLASPKKYNFWTKIYLEWLWVWDVQDRWWAIVEAWERWYNYDRIDLWVWHWDEWLLRAISWWKRTIKWKVLWENEISNIDTSNIEISSQAKKYLEKIKQSQNKTYTLNDKIKNKIDKVLYSIWNPNINDEWKNIKSMQTILRAIWYKTTKNWVFDETTKNTIITYQIDKKIISSKDDYGAWYFWPKTKNQINQDLTNKLLEYIKNKEKNIWMNY